jgi:DNA-directed RNA polymerase II subunit RPB1
METEIYSYNNDNIRKIKEIEFNVWGNDEILDNTSVNKDTEGINIPDLYDNQIPKRGGLIDSRMGTTSNAIRCATCGLNNIYCVGHFGHINLSEPVFHYGFLQYIRKILNCICIRCSKLLLYRNENGILNVLKTKGGKKRLNEIKKLTSGIKYCQKEFYGCGAPVSKIRVESLSIYAELNLEEYSKEKKDEIIKKKSKYNLTPELIYDILKNISDEDCKILGFNPNKMRPENLILKIFPVPPIQVRPSVRADFMSSGGSNMEDDLTHKLADIVKANLRIAKYKESDTSTKYNQDHLDLLQYHTAAFYDSELNMPKSEQKGKIIKSIRPRIKSKEGRIRNNLMSKRVNFSARTVITPDPTISINQLGLPIKVAMNLTFPEVVTPYNIDKLNKLIKNGRDKYPGANFVFPKSSTNPNRRSLPIELRYRKEKVELRYGDVVERHLMDGDIVLLNRQPTLHKQSMMGHKIKVINDPNLLTFRLSVTVTPPYNADFDGDEMNIFVPQTKQTQIELEEIANVKRQIISPAYSTPIVGIVQDGLIGSYNITNPDIKMNWKTAMNLISYTTLDDYKIFEKKQYNGNQIFSMIIPERINLKQKNINIKNGIIKDGVINKKLIGTGNNNLIQSIWDEYGVENTKNFLDNIQRLTNNFNMYNGFSVGIGDAIINNSIQEQIDKMISNKEIELDYLITEVENNPELMDMELFTKKITSELNNIRNDISKLIMENLNPKNNFNIMATSGSKGKKDNIGQISGCVGLQIVEGNLVRKKLNGRTLPYFFKGENSSSSNGLIKNAFINGMSYTELFFQSMAGREGLIQSAIKTAESGYIQRKLIKMLEDAKVSYDGTIRNSMNMVLQFTYGDSGADPIKQYKYNIKLIELGNSEIIEEHLFNKIEMKKYNVSEKINKDIYNRLVKFRDELRILKIKSRMNYITMTSDFMIPVNITRIINNTISEKTEKNNKLDVEYILEKIKNILDNENTKLFLHNKNNIDDEKLNKMILSITLYEVLSPKKCLLTYNFNREQFDIVYQKIINEFNKNMIEPGELVGILAAQSLGEPTTQMTLNSFHSSGIGSVSETTLGVPRIQELLSLSKNMKTPQMIVYLNDEYMENRDMSNKISSYIKYTNLGSLRENIKVYYDPKPKDKDSFMEKDNVTKLFSPSEITKISCQKNIELLPWLIRIELNREKMFKKEVSLLDIKSKFCNMWEKRFTDKSIKKEKKLLFKKITHLAILSNSDYDENPIIHIRINITDVNMTILNDFINIVIDNFKLKGIPNIKDISDSSEERVLNFNNEDKNLVKKKQFVTYTKGINLIDIRYLNGININKTICNDVNVIYKTFGIEAARSLLIREILYTYERAGAFVNYQHVSLLVDLMTLNGFLISIDRHGMAKSNVGPLSRASFERPIDELLHAALFAEKDNMESVSSRIMGGLVVSSGTGMCNVLLDTDMVLNSEFTEDISQKYVKTYNEVNENSHMKDLLTSKENEEDIFIPE